ncbi:MAG: PAS domain-containing protein, partial [Anaerolineales bacterium]
MVDKETTIHYANKAALRRFGKPPEQLIGKTLLESMSFPQVQARWQTILKALEQYKNFSFIDSGNGKYALTHILPFQNSSEEYYLIFTLENQSFASATFQETLKTVHATPVGDDPDHRPEYHLRILQALANAATGASLAQDLPTALNTLCTQACLALQAPAAVIRLYNPHQDTLEIAGSYGLSGEHLHKNFAIPYAPLAYLASESAPRVFVADLDQSPPTPADQLPYRPQLAASAVGNIVRQNRFLGVLVILIPKVHPPLTKEDLLLVQAIAEQASITLDRFHLMETQERRTKELENLVHLGIELREMLTKREIMDKLLEVLAKDSQVCFGATYLLEGQRYVFTSSRGERANIPPWLAIPDNPLWHGGKPLFFEQLSLAADLLTAGSYNPPNSETLSGLAIPL